MKKFKLEKSERLFKEALKYLPAGVSSNARLWRRLCRIGVPCSIYVDRARGSHLWDVDGNEYIDYRLGFGPVILGHSYPAVQKKIHEAEARGTVYALSTEKEIQVAKLIRQMVPSAQMVRFANSGTEATMHSLRVARAFTGREKVLKFEGHYHGAHDYLLFSTDAPFKKLHGKPIAMSQGIPKAIEKLVVTARWNDFEGVEKLMKKHELAAVICEPVMGNAGVIPPQNGFLKHLRQLCDKYGVVLIFDEVKTGFRLANGGAQEVFHVTPDMSTFSKSLGNGYPIAAFTGKREVMDVIGPEKVVHGGTFSSNPVSLTAALATLHELQRKNVVGHMQSYGRKLIKGFIQILSDRDLDFMIQGYATMFQFFFTKKSVWEYRDIENCNLNVYADLQMELLKRGVMFDEDNEEPLFTCYSHSQEDLNKTLEAFEATARKVWP
jgi:glutamate-1-semialdehyde 2,1-aminomutase